jgi:hypothetical protein
MNLRPLLLVSVLCGVPCAAYFVSGTTLPSSAKPRSSDPGTASPSSDPLGPMEQRIRELEGALRQKESHLRTLQLAESARTGANAPEARVTDSESERSYGELLDRRLTSGGLSKVAGQVEATLDEFTRSEVGRAAQAEVRCGGTLCRVSVDSEDAQRLEEALELLSAATLKELPVRVVVEKGNGARALYLATEPDALRGELHDTPEELPKKVVRLTPEDELDQEKL